MTYSSNGGHRPLPFDVRHCEYCCLGLCNTKGTAAELNCTLRERCCHGLCMLKRAPTLASIQNACFGNNLQCQCCCFAPQSMRASSRRLLGQEEPPPKTRTAELEEYVCSFCPQLSYKHRLIGFACCLTLGFILTFGSLFRIFRLVAGNPLPFVINYSAGGFALYVLVW